ncbi:MAG: NAD(P)/FAD-dependent oxidoreductase [Bacteroidia bacterium]|nr:NAD(P)/FAD-dependent oxidoreductase [Bacteroidia bacterium]
MITIVGAGLAGSLMAIYLAKKGYEVVVYERRPDMRIHNWERGKSINLAISKRGIHALEQVNLWQDILKIAIPMRGRMIHDAQKNTTFQPYGIHEHEVIYSVSRSALNIALMNAAEQNGVRIFFNHRCINVEKFETHVKLHFWNELTKEETSLEAQVVIGADGAFSAVRQNTFKVERFNYSQTFLDWGYKELTIPPGPNGTFLIEKNALHIWPRHDYMLIALPNTDGSFTCTLFLPFEGQISFDSISTDTQIETFFETNFPDAKALMPNLVAEYRQNPVSTLVYIQCAPWYYKDKIVLIGDACHAIVPFYGQGANASFEDCFILQSIIDKYPNQWDKIFQEYYHLRKPNADAICQLALQNFVEMQSKVADKKFLLRKQIEQKLYEHFGEKFTPQYNLVTHTTIPYAEALRIGNLQDGFLQNLANRINDISELNLNEIELPNFN